VLDTARWPSAFVTAIGDGTVAARLEEAAVASA
jgi:hypothetical protein